MMMFICSRCEDAPEVATIQVDDEGDPITEAESRGWTFGEFGPRCPRCSQDEEGGAGPSVDPFAATAAALVRQAVLARIDAKISLATEDGEIYTIGILYGLRDDIEKIDLGS